jgi:hypothetical protein
MTIVLSVLWFTASDLLLWYLLTFHLTIVLSVLWFTASDLLLWYLLTFLLTIVLSVLWFTASDLLLWYLVNHRTDNTMVKWKVRRYQRSKSQDRQYNGQMIKDKRTNNDLQNITQRNKDWATRIQLNSGGELRCSRRVIISCSTRGSLRVNLVANSLNRGINNSTNINKTNNHFSLHLKYGRDTHRW